MSTKFLIIRFSAFGDVTQTLSVPSAISEKFPDSEVHFVTRADLASLTNGHPRIFKTWAFKKTTGWFGLLKLGLQLRRENFDYVYDAHNNLRSFIISLLAVRLKTNFIRRSIRRWKRFLLFQFRINKFQMPFSGQRDLLEPLKPWGISEISPPAPQLFVDARALAVAKEMTKVFLTDGFVALAPSAAHLLKRWPKTYWQELILKEVDTKFVLLGGPEDVFLMDIQSVASDRVLNLAGKTNLSESAAVVFLSKFLIANDTGLLHVAEQLGKNAIALMGPAPFGFPSRKTTKILEKDLPCRPCSKHGQGPCVNKEFQKCMTDISVEEVSRLCKNWNQQ